MDRYVAPENRYEITETFLGGAMEVGASCILTEVAGWKILMDCGIRQKGSSKDSLPDLRKIQEKGGPDAIVISHAHMDHTGSLPIISKEYPYVPIYMTPMTADLTRVLLYDSIKLMKQAEDGIPLYAEKQVLDMLERVHPIRYNEPSEILPGVTLTMYPAGHIAGAACCYFQSEAGSVFYSGDFSIFAQNAIEGAMVPKLRPDIAILESTYGDRLHSNRQIEEDRLLDTVRECIEKKGKMLIPAFALGRSQEVLLILKRGMAKGTIPKVKVYADGMVRQICGVYERYPQFLRRNLARQAEKGKELFWSDEIQPVGPKDRREDLLDTTDPVIFVSSSGMLTGGPSVQYAAKIAPMENGYIVITGYQDEEAPGRQIMNLMEAKEAEERVLRLDGRTVPVKCKLCLVGLSAHGDRSEIEGLARKLTPRDLFLVHGDAKVIETLASTMELDYRTRIYTPKDGESFEIQLRSPRKQLKREFPFTMQKEENLWETADEGHRVSLEKQLRSFLLDHYRDRRLTIRELAFVYYGKDVTDDEVLENFRKAVLASAYITTDPRRLFLYVPASDEEVEEAEKPRGTNQQELTDLAKELFAGFPVKKIGLHIERKEIALTLDFPKPYLEKLQEPIREYREKTGYRVLVGTAPNEHAMNEFLSNAFGYSVQKISLSMQTHSATVKLNEPVEKEKTDKVRKEWEELTGYALNFTGAVSSKEGDAAGSESAGPHGAAGFDPGASGPLEQNAAFSLIRKRFEGNPNAPYKIGIANDSRGKYIRLNFISPEVGKRNTELLQELSKSTGWRIVISDAVNQVEVNARISGAAAESGIRLLKTPSYMPQQGIIQVVVPKDTDEASFAGFAKKAEEATGIPVQKKQ